MTEINYGPPYEVDGNCLYLIVKDKHGQTRKRLCNFAPYIIEQVTKNNGADCATWITLGGTREDGEALPSITIRGTELGSFDWLIDRWGADCYLEVTNNAREHVRVAIQKTAKNAKKTTIYTVTGWRKLYDGWHYLMPGDDEISVELPGKPQAYHMERNFSYCDIATAGGMLEQLAAPEEVTYTILSHVFSSPLKHFLKMAGCEPKFILWLVGKTGSCKSSLSAVMLSFFGYFTGTTLPMSFRDTANSINEQAYMIKDAPVVIDDFHPCDPKEQTKMNATAQNLIRNYGDHSGRARLSARCELMSAHPPQGNAIVTAEFSPDIGESGTARCFTIELNPGDVDLQTLSSLQTLAADGTLQRCGFAYTEWLRECFLCDEETVQQFVKALRTLFEKYRSEFRSSNTFSHGRVAENVAWLRMGFHFFLMFLDHHLCYGEAYLAQMEERFKEILYRIAHRQSSAINLDKPTHLFLRKFYAMLESGQVFLKNRESLAPDEFQPGVCVGYYDTERMYFFADQVHKLVRKQCNDQGENFTISCRSLLKALAEEGLIETTNGENTRSMHLDGKSRRVVVMDKFRAEIIAYGDVEK